jgi:hypothetical protein
MTFLVALVVLALGGLVFALRRGRRLSRRPLDQGAQDLAALRRNRAPSLTGNIRLALQRPEQLDRLLMQVHELEDRIADLDARFELRLMKQLNARTLDDWVLRPETLVTETTQRTFA